MAIYIDEQQLWKCHKHPSRRRKTGVCPKCLRERLITLCPDGGAPADSPSSSSSSSASFSLFSFSRGGSRRDSGTGNGETRRNLNTIDVDPALRKSRSVAIPFLRSRSRYVGNGGGGCDAAVAVENDKAVPAEVRRSKISLRSVFRVSRSKKCDVEDDGMEDASGVDDDLVMMRSRSVAAGAGAGSCAGSGAGAGDGAGKGFTPTTSKQKGWYFPSPINAFRYSKSPRSVTVT